MILFKDGLILTRTVKKEAFWMLWRYHVIVMWRHRWRHHSTALATFL